MSRNVLPGQPAAHEEIPTPAHDSGELEVSTDSRQVEDLERIERSQRIQKYIKLTKQLLGNSGIAIVGAEALASNVVVAGMLGAVGAIGLPIVAAAAAVALTLRMQDED